MASGRLRDCTVSFWPIVVRIVVSLGWSFIRCSRFALPLAPRGDTIGVADEGRSAHHHPQAHLEVLGGLVRSRSVSVFHLQLHYMPSCWACQSLFLRSFWLRYSVPPSCFCCRLV